jgi:hypothetical protein
MRDSLYRAGRADAVQWNYDSVTRKASDTYRRGVLMTDGCFTVLLADLLKRVPGLKSAMAPADIQIRTVIL